MGGHSGPTSVCTSPFQTPAQTHHTSHPRATHEPPKPVDSPPGQLCRPVAPPTSLLQIVFSSSCTVYGIPEKVPITEDTPLHACSPYGRTKEFQVCGVRH